MSAPDDRYKFIHHQLPQEESQKSSESIDASDLEGKVIENLKLLKGLIQSEKVKTQSLPAFLENKDSDKDPVKNIQNKIVDELFEFDIYKLALFAIPKKFLDECFELIIAAWRRKIQQHYPQTLSLEKIHFSKESFRAFIIALSLNVSLQALKLQNCSLKEYEIKLLAVFIKIHPTLIYLHLDDNPFSDEGLYSIVAALKYNTHIEHLSLINTNLTDKGATALCTLLLKRALKSLHLEKNVFSIETIERFKQLMDASKIIITFDEPII